jgi:hypothetical protein
MELTKEEASAVIVISLGTVPHPAAQELRTKPNCIEPASSCLFGGRDRDRTCDHHHVKVMLYR